MTPKMSIIPREAHFYKNFSRTSFNLTKFLSEEAFLQNHIALWRQLQRQRFLKYTFLSYQQYRVKVSHFQKTVNKSNLFYKKEISVY